MSIGRRQFGEHVEETGRTHAVTREKRPAAYWWRANGLIRFYGVVFLVGTKIADIVTTVVGLRFVPGIIEANPVADTVLAEWGLFGGLSVLGFASVAVAVLAAELFGVEIRRRLGLSKAALLAQASVHATLSALFGLVAIHNGLLIADQVTHTLGRTIGVGV